MVKRERKGPRPCSEGTATMSQSPQLSSPPSAVSTNRRRGQPPGSKNQKSNSLGENFTPQIIIVNRGENIQEKISNISQNSSRTIILSANGSLKSATVHHSGSPEIVRHEGCFTILSLGGSVMVESNSVSSRMSVSFAGIDGRVYGGQVAGPLLAASSVQVVLATTSKVPAKRQKVAAEKAEKETPAARSLFLQQGQNHSEQ